MRQRVSRWLPVDERWMSGPLPLIQRADVGDLQAMSPANSPELVDRTSIADVAVNVDPAKRPRFESSRLSDSCPRLEIRNPGQHCRMNPKLTNVCHRRQRISVCRLSRDS